MWTRFSNHARTVIFFAQEEAGRLGESFVSTEHLLLGILKQPESIGFRLLESIGVPPSRLRSELDEAIEHGTGRAGAEMQLTPLAKRTIDLAYDEARKLSDNFIGSEHLLLALIRQDQGLASIALARFDASLEKARSTVKTLRRTLPTPHPTLAETSRLAALGAESSVRRFTERARRVVFFAQEEASQLGQNEVAAEHLLLGLLRESDSLAARVLDRLGVSRDELRNGIKRRTPSATGRPLSPDLQLSLHGSQVIAQAREEAQQLQNPFVGTEHLLLGFVREGTGLTGELLRELGLTLEAVRLCVVQIQNEGQAATSVTSTPTPQERELAALTRHARTIVRRILALDPSCRESLRRSLFDEETTTPNGS
jgi:ATP-dependent Clp protease ATP-binding subunit ClpA